MQQTDGSEVLWTKHLEVSGLQALEVSGSLTPLPEGKFLGMIFMQQPDFFAATHILPFQEKVDALNWVMSFESKVALA